jgi:hypothetical protein
MSLGRAVVALLKSKRFWLWEIVGIIIYAIPAAIRFSTGRVTIPFLNYPGHWIGMFIPGNLLEKVIVNAFFPGGAGAVAGEVFVSQYLGSALGRKQLYLSRLAGAWTQTGIWSAFQFFGYTLFIMGPYGSNIFEHPVVFPINFVLATFSIFTPTVVGLLKLGISGAYRKLTLPTRRKTLNPIQARTAR